MQRRSLWLEWAGTALFALAFVGSASLFGWFAALDNRLYDHALALVRPEADERIVIVAIDDQSLAQLGRWPWPREVQQRLIDRLDQAGVAAVGYDVLFVEPAAGDDALAQAMTRGTPVFLPSELQPDAAGVYRQAAGPSPVLARAAAGIAAVHLLPDRDGIIRKAEAAIDLADGRIEQLATKVAAAAPGGAAAAVPGGRFGIAYPAPDAFRQVPFAAVVAGEVPPALLAGRLVLVGATADGLGDNHPVPIAAGGLAPGVVVQASIANTILTGTAIARLTPWTEAALALLFPAILLLCFLRLSPRTNLIVAVGLAIAAPILALGVLVAERLWVPPAAPVIGLLVVHAVWGWRRLSFTSRFLERQVQRLGADGSLALAAPAGLRRADAVAAEAEQLDRLIGQLHALRRFVAGIVETFPDAILVADRDGRIVLANAAAQALAGEVPTGQPLDRVLARLARHSGADGPFLRLEGGEILQRSEVTLTDGNLLVTFRDVSTPLRAAEEREEILQFLSHDMRSPNAAIVMLLEKHPALADPRSPRIHALDQVRNLAQHALSLANDFVQLARARNRTLEAEPIDLGDVAREAVDLASPAARARQITFVEQVGPGEAWIEGDRGMLVRALLNLLENAVKFAPEGAAVTVRLALQAEHAEFLVASPGPPMPPGRAARPFAIYAEGRDAGEAASRGLGLAFVATVARRHGGQAHYAYRDGAVSEFRIVLPSGTPATP